MQMVVNQQGHTDPVPRPDVVGVSEIAELLGVSRQWVLKLCERADFPEPAVLKGAKIWDRNDVIEWARRTGRMD